MQSRSNKHSISYVANDPKSRLLESMDKDKKMSALQNFLDTSIGKPLINIQPKFVRGQNQYQNIERSFENIQMDKGIFNRSTVS